MNTPTLGGSKDAQTDDDIDWELFEREIEENTDDSIVAPLTVDTTPRWLIYALGHLLWIGVVYGLLALNRQLPAYVVLVMALGTGMGLFRLDNSRWRYLAWPIWLLAVIGVCRWITRNSDNNPPWWIGPSLIITIVVCAYGLWRWGRLKLKAQRPKPPLILD